MGKSAICTLQPRRVSRGFPSTGLRPQHKAAGEQGHPAEPPQQQQPPHTHPSVRRPTTRFLHASSSSSSPHAAARPPPPAQHMHNPRYILPSPSSPPKAPPHPISPPISVSLRRHTLSPTHKSPRASLFPCLTHPPHRTPRPLPIPPTPLPHIKAHLTLPPHPQTPSQIHPSTPNPTALRYSPLCKPHPTHRTPRNPPRTLPPCNVSYRMCSS